MKNTFTWTLECKLHISDYGWATMINKVLNGEDPEDVVSDYISGLDDADYYTVTETVEEEIVDELIQLTKH